MTETKTYNGWTNYETWNVALWIDNEEGSYSYNYWRERARECLSAAKQSESWSKEENAVFLLADALKEEIESDMYTWLEESKRACSMWADLLGAAVSEVNWREIAENWIDEIKE